MGSTLFLFAGSSISGGWEVRRSRIDFTNLTNPTMERSHNRLEKTIHDHAKNQKSDHENESDCYGCHADVLCFPRSICGNSQVERECVWPDGRGDVVSSLV